MDLADLEKWCTALPARIDDAANRLAVIVTTEMADDVIEHTPVDTSEAESNWQASLNVAPYLPLPAIYEGERGSTAAASAREALAHVKRTLKDKRPGEAAYLSNLAEHIVDLNDGTSKQEPAGFVERAERKGAVKADATGLEVKA